MRPDLFWVPGPWPGKLAITTRPRGGDWLADEVKGWRDAGLDAVVSLLEPQEATQLGLDEEPRSTAASNLAFLQFPIPDRGVPASTAAAGPFIQELFRRLTTGQHVAIHCRQGVGRSGMIAAAILSLAGVDVESAIQTVTQARGIKIPETEPQKEWLRRFSAENTAENTKVPA